MVDYGTEDKKKLKDRVVLKWGDATEIGYDDNTLTYGQWHLVLEIFQIKLKL